MVILVFRVGIFVPSPGISVLSLSISLVLPVGFYEFIFQYIVFFSLAVLLQLFSVESKQVKVALLLVQEPEHFILIAGRHQVSDIVLWLQTDLYIE